MTDSRTWKKPITPEKEREIKAYDDQIRLAFADAPIEVEA